MQAAEIAALGVNPVSGLGHVQELGQTGNEDHGH
jgi:hypothetical protein